MSWKKRKSKLITDSYQSSIKDNKLNPVHVPKIENVEFDGSQALSYSAEFEIEPEFDLKAYADIKVKVDKIKVKDEEVDEHIQRIRESQATLETVAENRSGVMGDFVVIELQDCRRRW